jgi:hypothetical protein
VCALAPGAPNVKRVQSAAAEAVQLNNTDYSYARSLGAVLYRSGRHEDAVKELTRALTLRTQPSPSVWLLLSMAQQRCGNGDKAREWLVKARDWIALARHQSNDGAGPEWPRLPWTERLALERLLAEAKGVVDAAGK